MGLRYLEFSEPPDACLATRAGSAAGRPSCDSRGCGGVEFSPVMAVALSAPAPWVRAAGRDRTPPPGVCMHTAWMVSMALLNASRLLATTSWLRSSCRQEGRDNRESIEHGISRSHTRRVLSLQHVGMLPLHRSLQGGFVMRYLCYTTSRMIPDGYKRTH